MGTKGALWSLREECSNRYVEGKVERDLHKGLVVASTSQPKTFLSACWDKLGLGTEARAPEVTERTGIGCLKTA